MGSEKRDELDQLIDSALAGYSDAEPLAGLEERVLERVRLARKRKHIWWGWVAAAIAAAAVVFVMADRPRPVQPLVGQAVRPAVGPLPDAPAQTQRQAEGPVPHEPRNPAIRRKLPKRDQFPTPAPLTSEERALLQLARLHPEELPPTGELKPIEIVPIEITPLRIDEDR
jgi:hypothetical protein